MELREASCSMTLFPAAPGVCWRPKSYWQRVVPSHLGPQRLCCFRSLRWLHWEPETLGCHLDLAFCLPWLASWPGGRLGSSTGWWPTTLLRDLQCACPLARAGCGPYQSELPDCARHQQLHLAHLRGAACFLARAGYGRSYDDGLISNTNNKTPRGPGTSARAEEGNQNPNLNCELHSNYINFNGVDDYKNVWGQTAFHNRRQACKYGGSRPAERVRAAKASTRSTGT